MSWFIYIYTIDKSMHYIRFSVATVVATPIYINWLINQPTTKCCMKGVYQLTWMIFSVVMLNMQYVGMYYGSNWRHLIPLHVIQHVYERYLEWFLIPPRKPLDPIHAVKVFIEESTNDHYPSPIDQIYSINNIIYSVPKKSVTTSRDIILEYISG